MINRLNKLLESFKNKKRKVELDVSTTVDDMSEGKRITFKKERVTELLIKCGLLEESKLPISPTVKKDIQS